MFLSLRRISSPPESPLSDQTQFPLSETEETGLGPSTIRTLSRRVYTFTLSREDILFSVSYPKY